jgi:hypothetical protein
MTEMTETAGKAEQTLLIGIISRIVSSYGATWGQISMSGSSRKVFYNRASFVAEADLEGLTLGDEVYFEEQPDRINGSRAIT